MIDITRKLVTRQVGHEQTLEAALRYLEEHPEIGRREKIALLCEVALRLERAGDYGRACEALRDVWGGPGSEPEVTGLDEKTATRVYLRSGYLTYRVGIGRLSPGMFEAAKNLFSEAQRRGAWSSEAEAEAINGLAQCVWRLGDCDTARMLLHGVMERLEGSESEQLCYAVVILGNVEWSDGRAQEAVSLLSSRAGLFHDGRSHALLARYESALGQALHLAGEVETALATHERAGRHFAAAGDVRQSGRMDNNVGYGLAALNRHAEAAEYFSSAREKFVEVGDGVAAACVDDSEAQSCIAQRQYGKAETLAARAVDALAGTDHAAAYVEALTTCGRALGRAGKLADASARFERALEVALDKLGTDSAARVKEAYREEVIIALFSEPFSDPGMTYYTARHTVERALIRKAMLECKGVQRQAAFKLGMLPEALRQLLRGTHKEITDELNGKQLSASARVTAR
jgi:tetratricopeptide (TPR) repeat protein